MFPSIIEVHKDIWLALDAKEGNILNWTPDKPEFDNGMIAAGTILHFDHMYEDAGNYSPYGEFVEDDISKLLLSNSIIVHY